MVLIPACIIVKGLRHTVARCYYFWAHSINIDLFELKPHVYQPVLIAYTREFTAAWSAQHNFDRLVNGNPRVKL